MVWDTRLSGLFTDLFLLRTGRLGLSGLLPVEWLELLSPSVGPPVRVRPKTANVSSSGLSESYPAHPLLQNVLLFRPRDRPVLLFMLLTLLFSLHFLFSSLPVSLSLSSSLTWFFFFFFSLSISLPLSHCSSRNGSDLHPLRPYLLV